MTSSAGRQPTQRLRGPHGSAGGLERARPAGRWALNGDAGRNGRLAMMTVGVERVAGETTIRVSGELDCATAQTLAEPLFEAVDAREWIIVDLSRCTFMDSTGLMVLVKAAAGAAGRLGTICVPGQILRLLELTACDRRLSLRVARPD